MADNPSPCLVSPAPGIDWRRGLPIALIGPDDNRRRRQSRPWPDAGAARSASFPAIRRDWTMLHRMPERSTTSSLSSWTAIPNMR